MTIQQILNKLERGGYRLWVEGSHLRVQGTVAPITENLLQTLKSHKPELIKALNGECPRPYFDQQGDLVIPFDCSGQYHWGKPDGRSIREIKEEVRRHSVN